MQTGRRARRNGFVSSGLCGAFTDTWNCSGPRLCSHTHFHSLRWLHYEHNLSAHAIARANGTAQEQNTAARVHPPSESGAGAERGSGRGGRG